MANWFLFGTAVLVEAGIVKIAYDLGFAEGWKRCYGQYFTSGDYEIRKLGGGSGIAHY